MADEKIRLCGKIVSVLQVKSGVTQKGEWVAQEYVLETNDKYPKKICFEVYGNDRIEKFNLKVGDEVEVYVNIDSKEYSGRWYNTIQAWAVNKKGGNNNNSDNVHSSVNTKKTVNESTITDVNQLPF